jgi:hypothetical protein
MGHAVADGHGNTLIVDGAAMFMLVGVTPQQLSLSNFSVV